MSEQCSKKQKPSGWTLAWSRKWQHEKLIQLSYTYIHQVTTYTTFTNSNKYIVTLIATTSNRKVDRSSSNSIKFDYPEGGICNFSYRYCWANT